jgi:hypothetical protein
VPSNLKAESAVIKRFMQNATPYMRSRRFLLAKPAR